MPTWNYIAVHVYGKIQILNDEAVLDSLHKLVDKYEKASTNPVSINNLSHKTMRQIKGIVGFQIGITDIHATYKLSQTRPEDHPKIIEELQKTNNPGSHEIANMIKQKK